MRTVIECEKLFDGEEVHPGGTVVLDGDRVREVLPRGATAPQAEQSYTCSFAMPGLIDSQLHLEGYAEGSPAGAPFQPVKAFLRLLLYNGVTAVRDVGNSLETIDYLRRWSRKFEGTEVVSSGPVLDAPPLHWSFTRVVEDPEAARREVGLLHLEGVDFIKAETNLRLEVLREVVRAAAEHGLAVSHHPGAASALAACELEVRCLEDLEAIAGSIAAPQGGGDLAAAEGSVAALVEHLSRGATFVAPTLFANRRRGDLEAALGDPHLDLMVAVLPYHKYFQQMRRPFSRNAALENLKPYLGWDPGAGAGDRSARLDALDALFARLAAAGARIVAGSGAPDTGVVPGFSLHQELAAMVAAGLEPVAALRAATSEAARLLGRDDLGVVRAGAQADLLLLDADPTLDVTATSRIREVIKVGRRVDREKTLSYVRAMLD